MWGLALSCNMQTPLINRLLLLFWMVFFNFLGSHNILLRRWSAPKVHIRLIWYLFVVLKYWRHDYCTISHLAADPIDMFPEKNSHDHSFQRKELVLALFWRGEVKLYDSVDNITNKYSLRPWKLQYTYFLDPPRNFYVIVLRPLFFRMQEQISITKIYYKYIRFSSQ